MCEHHISGICQGSPGDAGSYSSSVHMELATHHGAQCPCLSAGRKKKGRCCKVGTHSGYINSEGASHSALRTS